MREWHNLEGSGDVGRCLYSFRKVGRNKADYRHFLPDCIEFVVKDCPEALFSCPERVCVCVQPLYHLPAMHDDCTFEPYTDQQVYSVIYMLYMMSSACWDCTCILHYMTIVMKNIESTQRVFRHLTEHLDDRGAACADANYMRLARHLHALQDVYALKAHRDHPAEHANDRLTACSRHLHMQPRCHLDSLHNDTYMHYLQMYSALLYNRHAEYVTHKQTGCSRISHIAVHTYTAPQQGRTCL